MRHELACAALVVLSACGEAPVLPPEVTPLPEATFAGRTANEDLFAAVVSAPAGLEVYLCDGKKDFWFRGAGAAESVLEFEEAGGARLALQLDAERAVGTLVEADGVETALSLPRVDGDVLFRAEDIVGETPVLGGWIRLPDGAQRGAIRLGSTTTTSSLDTSGLVCLNCAGLTAGLTPAPFTPTAAQTRPNVMPRFTVIGLGDSYMSGEGAPVVLGNLSDNGATGTQEQWSTGRPVGEAFTFSFAAGEEAALAREARACHRGAAGLGLAVRSLQLAWTRVQLIHQTFACSGAKATHLVSSRYGGPAGCSRQPTQQAIDECVARTDDFATDLVEPQLPSAMGFLARNRLAPDAVVMSIGGNDLGFGDIIADCIAADCAATGSASRTIFAAGAQSLPSRYQELARALFSAGVPATNVHLTQYPNPLRRSSTDLCAGGEFSDVLLQQVSEDEAAFATSVHGDINRLVSTAAATHGWRVVSSHVGAEVGHAVCSGAQAWFNDTPTALATQGADLLPQAAGLLQLSAGMVHPNQAGHRDGYAPAFRDSLERALRVRMTPRRPLNFRATRFTRDASGTRVTLQWDDVNTFESVNLVRGENGAPSAGTRGDATGVEVAFSTPASGAPRGTFFLKACFDGPTQLCSPETAGVEVEVRVPSHTPTDVTAAASLSPQGIRVSWRDRAPTRLFTTVELDIGGVISRRAVEGQSLLLPATTDLRRYRVAACNTLGCGPATLFQAFQRPVESLPPPCVFPQQPTLDGCR